MNNVQRLSRQANDGLSAYLRGGRPTSNDWEDDNEECDEFEDYFQTLVTRGTPRGVLTVHIKTCTDFKNISVKRGTQSFLRVSIGENVKCTRLQPYNDPKSSEGNIAITFNEWKYFSIRIPKEGEKLLDTAHKIIVLELIFFEPDTGVPKLMGKALVKLLEVLKKDRMTIHLELKLSRQVICKLELDLVITYGTFGYGYSHQLKHPKRSMESFVDRSLFLRCPPPLERRDEHYNVLTARPMPYLDIIGSLLSRETTGPDAPDSNRIFPQKLMDQLQRRGRLLQLHETFESYDSQADVLSDLEKIIYKRGLQMSTSWRQHRKAKKALSRWKTKASLIPKLLGFVGENKKGPTPGSPPPPTMRSALLAAARKAQRMEAPCEDVEEPQPEASTAGPPPPTMQSALLAAARKAQRSEAPCEDVEEPQPEASTAGPPPPTMQSALLAAARKAQRMEAPCEDVEESTNATADPHPDPSTSPPSAPPCPLSPRGVLDPPSPMPLFRPGESLLSADDAASISTAKRTDGAQQHQRSEEDTVVRGLKSLSLGSETPPSLSCRDTPTAASPGQAGLSGPATAGRLGAGALERLPQASSPQGAGGSIWGMLKSTSGTQEQTDQVYPGTSAPGKLNLPRSHSPALSGAGTTPVIAAPKPDSAPPAPGQNRPPSHALVRPANPPAPGEDPVETWLRAPSSIPSLSSVISEMDLEPIRSNLAFPSATSSQSPQAAGSSSASTGGHRSKPGRDKLKAQEGTSAPYRRPSHPR